MVPHWISNSTLIKLVEYCVCDIHVNVEFNGNEIKINQISHLIF